MKTMLISPARNACAQSGIVGVRTSIISGKSIILSLILFLSLFVQIMFAQGVVIGESAGLTADGNAILDLRSASATRGFLVPQLAAWSGGTPDAGAKGLMYFNTGTNSFNFWNSTTWVVLATTGNLSQFAATTSAQLSSIISDETGSGSLVFATSPTLVTPNIGAATGTSLSVTGALTAQVTTNQLVLGTTNTTTFSATAPTASRVITFQDPGAAANVIYDVLAQTLTGAKIFSALGTFNLGITSTGAIVNLNASSNYATNINTGTSTGAVNIANGGTGGNVIAIGNTNGATSITENIGTGNYVLNGVAGSTYTIGASTTTGTIAIGGTTQTGAITLGSSTGTGQTVNIATGNTTGTDVVNIATGTATTAKQVNIATSGATGTTVSIANGASAAAVSIGSTTGAASTTIKAGTGGILLSSNNATAGVTVNGAFNYGGTATFAANAYSITITPAPTAYITGMMVSFTSANANTSATPSLNVNALGAKTIVKRQATALVNNDIIASGVYVLIYNGTNFQLLDPNSAY